MGARGLVALVSACCFSVVLGFTVDCDRRDPVCLKAIQELNLAHNLTSMHEALKTTTNAPASETTFVPTALPPISPEINISEIAEIFDQGSRAKALEDIMEKEADTPMKILNLSSKGRALNLSLDDLQSFTNSLQNHTSGPMEVREISSTPTYIGRHTDLSDVSLDNDDNMDFQFPGMVKPAIPEERVVNKGNSLEYLKLKDFLEPSTAATADHTLAMCKDNNVLYQTGDKLQRGCEEICICTEGLDGASASWECAPRCLKPYFRKGRGLTDPLCSERAVEDPCCAILVCAADDSKTPKNPAAVDNSCFQNNVSHSLGSTWNVGCEKVCTCGSHNNIGCKPRCPPIIPLEHCVNVQDPADACCLVQLCDVSQDVHEEVLVVKDLEKNLEEKKKHNLTSTQELHNMLTDLTSNNIKMPEMASSTLARDKNTTAANSHEDVIISVDVIRNGTVKVNLARTNPPNDPVHLQISSDNGKTFSDITLEPSNFLMNLKVGEEYVLKAKNSEKEFKFTAKGEFKENETDKDHSENETNKVGCHQDGAFYEVGTEFNVGCTELCECTGLEQRECAALRCPSSVGLDVLDPGCVRWAPDPPSFVPHPPHCCAERMRCLSNGSCQYEGHEIPNWSEVPISLTGCERRCFCESGSLDCQSVCESVPAQPPPALRCAARQRPGLVNVPGDDCCKQWGCIDVGPTQNHNFVLPTNVNQFNGHPIFLPTVSPNNDFLPNVKEELIPESNDIRPPPKNKPSKHDNKPENPGVNDVAHHEENEDNEDSGSNEFDTPVFHQIDSIGDNRLTVLSLKSDSPTSLKMLLGLPAVLVGLRGRMDLRYTDSDDDDVSEWESQVFAPADEVLGTARLEFRLTGLQPHTEYKVRAELLLHRMDNGPISGIYTITTQDEPPVEEIRRPIDGGLNLLELNSTSADLGWRHFSMEEQKYIDGIQIRYRPVGVAIYSTTELLHRSRVSATLVGLRADTHYEAALVLAPLLPPAPRIELYDERVLNFHTPPIQDMYNWSVILEATEIGSQSALVRWRGVAEPPERFVSVYRAAHACEGDNHNDVTSTDEAAFKLPSREDEPTLRVVGLQPGTRCRVWLELFLTNGKTKTSNVLDILTKPTDTSLDTNSLDYSREATSAGVAGGRRGDYYVPLVAVAVVAALGALSSLLLLLVLLRRHRPHSVSITSAPTAPTAPRALPTLPPYENPAYKLEYQQETMDL